MRANQRPLRRQAARVIISLTPVFRKVFRDSALEASARLLREERGKSCSSPFVLQLLRVQGLVGIAVFQMEA